MPTAEPEPEPEPPAALLTLEGTWRSSNNWIDDEGRERTEITVLTLTGGGRAIEHLVELDTADGEVLESWTGNRAGWSAVEDTVTRTFYYDHDDNDDTEDAVESVVKRYYWGEDRDSVFIEDWGAQQPGGSVRRYVRVDDPLPNLTGTWVYVRPWNPDEISTLTINADGSVAFLEQRDDGTSWLLAGRIGTVDPVTYLAELTELMSTPFDADGAPLREPMLWKVGVGQVGFAPGVGGRIVVSPPWVDGDTPYGGYHFVMVRAE